MPIGIAITNSLPMMPQTSAGIPDNASTDSSGEIHETNATGTVKETQAE